MIKVLTIVGTRPEIIRLSRLIPKLDTHTHHVFVHTGQNNHPNLSDIFFRDLELRQPDYFLGIDSTTMGSAMADTIRKVENVLLEELPDAVLILGDTNSAIAAVVAERMHIPVYHMEAGNRSFDENVPEELNRKLIDHIASFNLPYNDYAMRNLLSEGLHPRRIQKTGSPILEIINHYKSKIDASTILSRLELEPKAYFLVSVHRQENVDSPERLNQVLGCLRVLRDVWKLPVLVSTHPRTQSKLRTQDLRDLDGIIFHEPFGYLDYNKLQAEAFFVVSDSGTISEESAILGFPAVSFRDSIERPEALETGATILASLDSAHLIASIRLRLASTDSPKVPDGYDVDDFSDRVLNFVFSTVRQHKWWSGLRK